MARNSKVVSIDLKTERRHDHVTVEFTRNYDKFRLDRVSGRFDSHRYTLKSRDSVERVYDIVNHPLAAIEEIDAGTRGDLAVEVDVRGLQNTEL